MLNDKVLLISALDDIKEIGLEESEMQVQQSWQHSS